LIITIVQARMSSSRLPGKVLRPILGRPMLALQLERIARSRRIGRLVVATSSGGDDDVIAEACAAWGVPCWRGALHDVLDRFYQAARHFAATQVVRLTADCPLTDWRVIDNVIERHVETNAEYTSNTVQRSFPVGLDTEIMRFEALEAAWRDATGQADREHVTRFIYTHPGRFQIEQVVQNDDFSPLRWTVDTPADFDLVRHVYEKLYLENPRFTTENILDLLKHRPDIAKVNASETALAVYRRLQSVQRRS
jgi:spore coat polysaccharide biosynthesis protein SpsF